MPTTLLYINSADRKNNDDDWKSDPHGVYIVKFDTDTGAMEIIDHDDTVSSTQFFHVDTVNNRLFAAHRPIGEPIGDLLAFDIDPTTGKLTYLNRQ